MDSELLVTWALIGLLTGGVAGILMKVGGHGWVWDLVLGLIGSIAASGLWGLLAPETGEYAMAVIALAGAAAVVIAQRKIWYARA